MQITGGSARGLRIEAPPGNRVRPTTDRIRESLFSILKDLVPGARVLDLYAGSGSLGLEAASRGADEVHWVEKHGRTCAALKANAKRLAPAGITAGLFPHQAPVHGFLQNWADGPFDLVFADPPYADLESPAALPALLSALDLSGAWSTDGLFVLEGPGILDPVWPAPWSCLRRQDYGTTHVWFLEQELP